MTIFNSSIRCYSTSVLVDGTTRYVHFTDRGRPFSSGYYVCKEEALAEALKKHPEFGHIITIQKKETASVVEKKYEEVYNEVKRTQEANKILVEKYGVNKETLKGKQDALNAAESLNISFPNL